MRTFPIATLFVITAILAGCVGAAMSASTLAVRAAPREELRPLAEAGDSAAQYELGKSYCCMGAGFDTQTATEWLCKSARQGNADAMYELGRIYDGDVSRTMAPGQKLMQAVRARESAAHAYLWLSLAASVDYPEAQQRLAGVRKKISVNDGVVVERLREAWQDAPCEYDDVFLVD